MVDGKETKVADGRGHWITGNVEDHQTSQVLYTTNKTILTTRVLASTLPNNRRSWITAQSYSPHDLAKGQVLLATEKIEFSSN